MFVVVKRSVNVRCGPEVCECLMWFRGVSLSDVVKRCASVWCGPGLCEYVLCSRGV